MAVGRVNTSNYVPLDFASMALLASIQAKDKEVTKQRADKLLRHPMFKDWKDRHGAALKKGLDLSKIF